MVVIFFLPLPSSRLPIGYTVDHMVRLYLPRIGNKSNHSFVLRNVLVGLLACCQMGLNVARRFIKLYLKHRTSWIKMSRESLQVCLKLARARVCVCDRIEINRQEKVISLILSLQWKHFVGKNSPSKWHHMLFLLRMGYSTTQNRACLIGFVLVDWSENAVIFRSHDYIKLSFVLFI